MELLQLRYFLETSKNNNIARTAEKFLVPPSSVSASLKRLEEELGCKLFDRKSNRISLNDNGRVLQKTVGPLMEELDLAVETLKNPTPPQTEISVLILGRRERMMHAIIEYQKLHPNVSFHAMFSLEDVNLADWDLIVDKDNGAYPEYNRWELCSKQLCFRVPKNSPLVGRELTMRDLRHERFMTMEEANDDSVLIEICQRAGFYPNVVMRTNDSMCFNYAAQAGIGISLWKAYNEPCLEGLVNLQVKDLQARETTYLYYRPNVTDVRLKGFIEFLKRWEF